MEKNKKRKVLVLDNANLHAILKTVTDKLEEDDKKKQQVRELKKAKIEERLQVQQLRIQKKEDKKEEVKKRILEKQSHRKKEKKNKNKVSENIIPKKRVSFKESL